MRISVVITYFRKGNLVLRAVNSIKNQLGPGDEVLIVDDASKDSFATSALEILRMARIRSNLTSLRVNSGPGNAKNVGIDLARGDIVVLLDADDELPPKSIDIIRQAFIGSPRADFVFGDYLVRDEMSNQVEYVNCSRLTTPDGLLDMEKLANHWILLGSSPFRKSRLWPTNKYPTDYASTDDLDFWRAAILAGAKGIYIGEQIYVWNRQRSSNNSSQSSRTLAESWLRNRAFYRKALPARRYWRLLVRNFLAASFLGQLFRTFATFFERWR